VRVCVGVCVCVVGCVRVCVGVCARACVLVICNKANSTESIELSVLTHTHVHNCSFSLSLLFVACCLNLTTEQVNIRKDTNI